MVPVFLAPRFVQDSPGLKSPQVGVWPGQLVCGNNFCVQLVSPSHNRICSTLCSWISGPKNRLEGWKSLLNVCCTVELQAIHEAKQKVSQQRAVRRKFAEACWLHVNFRRIVADAKLVKQSMQKEAEANRAACRMFVCSGIYLRMRFR